jgi:tetratricopeptide (TPR) repeat protein
VSGTTAPPDAAALLQAAVTAHKAGQLDEAIALYRQTLDRAPAMARAHSNLGAALLAKELEGRALAHLKHAVRIAPADPVAQLNLGVGLNALNRHAEAEHVFRSLLAQPRSEGDSDLIGQTCIGLGLALRGQGRFDDSLAIWRRAVALMPKDALAHVNLSMALLTEGRFADGWAEFRWRMRLTDEMHRIGPRQMNRPRWDGRPFAGKTLLVHGEQGYGDNIQFVRLCARAKALGGTVLFACRRELDRLLASCAGIDRVLVPPADDPDQKLDLTDLPHDLQLPLMDLPHALGLRLDDLPGTLPYLAPDAAARARWAARDWPAGLKVGLVWAGSATHANDHNRSIDFALFSRILKAPGATYYSLQKERGEAAAGSGIVDLGPQLEDFTDTAAALEYLDLLIAVDTSVVHLAGAMNRCGHWCRRWPTGVGCATPTARRGTRRCGCTANRTPAPGPKSSTASPPTYARSRRRRCGKPQRIAQRPPAAPQPRRGQRLRRRPQFQPRRRQGFDHRRAVVADAGRVAAEQKAVARLAFLREPHTAVEHAHARPAPVPEHQQLVVPQVDRLRQHRHVVHLGLLHAPGACKQWRWRH